MTSCNFDNNDNFIDSRNVISAIEDFETEIEDIESDIDELQEEVDELEEKRTDEEDDEAIEAFNKDIEKVESKIQEKKDEKLVLVAELEILTDLQDEFEGYCDWKHGETLIRWNRIDEYLKDEVSDLGYIPEDFPHWIVIDWDETCDNLKADYTSGYFDGIEYWVRSS
jgi:chromosome segregation ATPase